MDNRFIDSILGYFSNRTKSEIASVVPSSEVNERRPPTTPIQSSDGVSYFLGASTILAQEQCVYCVAQIKETAGLSDEAFDRYYLPVIENFAVLCQDIGASERYHHAYKFGLIEHSLEVALYAMRMAQGCVYHPDRHVETIQWIERVFMYAVFCAGLLHDAGKVITNTKWLIRNSEGDWVYWSPLIHSTPKEIERIEYRALPYQNKDGINVFLKTSHELFAPSMLLDLLPKDGLDWILSFSHEYCAELFIHFIHTLGSDYANGNDIGACVKAADQKSTEDAIKRYHQGSASHYVDMSDPNLPLHESYKVVFQELFSSPDAFHLSVNKVAMGKFSHMERFGNLLFVSAKSVLPIVNKQLKERSVKIPNDQSVYTLLSDNGITINAPSGDTLWWVEFFSPNNNNKSREMSYLVFDVSFVPHLTIPDLRSFGVECLISPKTFGEGVVIKDTTYETLSAFPALLTKVYPADSPISESDRVSSEKSPQHEIASPPVDESPKEPDNRSLAVSDTSKPAGARIEHVATPPSTTNVPVMEVKELNEELPAVESMEMTPLTPLSPINMISHSAVDSEVTKSTDSTIQPTKASKASKKKSRNRGKQGKTDRFSVGVEKALGLNLSSTQGNAVFVNANDDAVPTSAVSSQPQSATDDVHEELVCQIPVGGSANQTSMVSPFGVAKISTMPSEQAIEPAVLASIIDRKLPLRLSEAKYYDGATAEQCGKRLITTWLPFLSAMIERKLMTANEEGSAIFQTGAGLCVVPSVIEPLLSEDLYLDLVTTLQHSVFTILDQNGGDLHSVVSDYGLNVRGYVLGVRKLVQSEPPLPLLQGLRIL